MTFFHYVHLLFPIFLWTFIFPFLSGLLFNQWISSKFIYLNLHIDSFNYAIKNIIFDFCSTNMGSSVTKTGRSEGSLLPYFYQFRCHYPLITYLNARVRARLSQFPLSVSFFFFFLYVILQ